MEYILESNKVTLLGHINTLEHALSPYLNLLFGLGCGRRLSAKYLECVLKQDSAIAQGPGKFGVPYYLVLVLADTELSVKGLLKQVGEDGVALNAHDVRFRLEHATQEAKACIEEQWL